MSDRNVSNAIRVGQVSSVNPKNNTVRVAFDDLKNSDGKEFVSGEMQMLQKNTSKARVLSLPEVGEHVLCTYLPNGNQEGFVMGSFYTARNMPDADGTGVYRTEYADGTIIEYNLGSNTAKIDSKYYVVVKCKEATVEVEETATVTAKNADIIIEETLTATAKNIKATVEETANIMARDIVATAERDATVTAQRVTIQAAEVATVAAQEVNIAAKTINLGGDVNIGGNLVVSGSITPPLL